MCRDTFSTKPAKVGQRRHQEGSAGTKSGSSARSLVLLTMLLLAPVVENRTVHRDQLQLDDEANSEIAR